MRTLVGSAFAAGLLLVAGGASWANDTVRLGGPAAQAAISGGTDTELVHRRYGGYGHHGHYGHHHGHYGRHYGHYHGGYYGGYRGYYGGYGYGVRYASPYLSVSYYSSPSYGYYDPYYYSNYRPVYYRPNYYHGSYYPYYPIAGEAVPAPVTTVQQVYSPPAPQRFAPPMPPPEGNGPLQYDGGPRNPVPMPTPGAAPNPGATPNGIVPIDGRLVSMPTQTSGGMSPVGVLTQPRQANPTNPARVNYPAYGDEPIPAVPRKR